MTDPNIVIQLENISSQLNGFDWALVLMALLLVLITLLLWIGLWSK